MRVGIIGDVHGHYREMIATINQLEEHGVDRLILLGDLLDRGPDGLRCLRHIRTESFMDRQGGDSAFECIKGNHEDAYVRVWRNVPKPGRSYVESPEYPRLYAQMDADLLSWMEQLPVFIRLSSMGLVCLHGGVTPHTTSLRTGGDFLLRTRYLDARGNAERGVFSGDRFWADAYDGRFGTIVFGHESHDQPTRYKHALAVDGEGYGKIHAVVYTDEDEPVAAYTTPYDGVTHDARLTVRPDRYHETRRSAYSSTLLW